MDAALSFVDRLARHDPRCGPTWAGTPAADQEHARVTAEFWLEMLWHEFGLSPRLLRAACWLAECLRHGVGYHCGSLSREDRALTEGLFCEGALPVLCTTSTLAMGVNLPAHLVVVKSTQAWRGTGRGYEELSSTALLQMVGRAGRPQFDARGVAERRIIFRQRVTHA